MLGGDVVSYSTLAGAHKPRRVGRSYRQPTIATQAALHAVDEEAPASLLSAQETVSSLDLIQNEIQLRSEGSIRFHARDSVAPKLIAENLPQDLCRRRLIDSFLTTSNERTCLRLILVRVVVENDVKRVLLVQER
jgi:hypothetical protein